MTETATVPLRRRRKTKSPIDEPAAPWWWIRHNFRETPSYLLGLSPLAEKAFDRIRDHAAANEHRPGYAVWADGSAMTIPEIVVSWCSSMLGWYSKTELEALVVEGFRTGAYVWSEGHILAVPVIVKLVADEKLRADQKKAQKLAAEELSAKMSALAHKRWDKEGRLPAADQKKLDRVTIDGQTTMPFAPLASSSMVYADAIALQNRMRAECVPSEIFVEPPTVSDSNGIAAPAASENACENDAGDAGDVLQQELELDLRKDSLPPRAAAEAKADAGPATQKSKSNFPAEGFTPTEQQAKFATKLWAAENRPDIEIERELRRFASYARAHGLISQDWSASWDKWVETAPSIPPTRPLTKYRPPRDVVEAKPGTAFFRGHTPGLEHFCDGCATHHKWACAGCMFEGDVWCQAAMDADWERKNL